jgi:hypothetical protein
MTTDRTVNFNMVVDNKRNAQCSSCSFTYSYWNTPQIQSIHPAAGSPGEVIQFYGVQRVSTIEDIDFFKIGDLMCNLNVNNEYDPLTFGNNSDVQIPCGVPSNSPGLYSVSQRNLYNTGNAWKLKSATIYHYGKNQYYDFATIPRITSLSTNTGSKFGQKITVNGVGFATTGNVVSLGGVVCDVVTETSTKIDCVLREVTSAIPVQGYHSGLKWDVWYNTTNMDTARLVTRAPNTTTSRLDTEVVGLDTYYVSKLSGFFKAPKTGDYKFFLSVDDNARLYLDTTPGSTSGSAIIASTGWTNYKFSWSKTSTAKIISDPVSLTAGEYYYMETIHNQGVGPDYLTLGVQIPGMANDVSTVPHIVDITLVCPTINEIIDFTVNGDTGGTWRLEFPYVNGRSMSWKNTSTLTFGATEAQVKTALQNIGFNTLVTISSTTATSIVYTVQFVTRHDATSTPLVRGISASPVVSGSGVKTQSVSAPLSGSWRLSKGINSVTLQANARNSDVTQALITLGYAPNVRGEEYGDFRNGISYRVVFAGNAGAIDPFTAESVTLSGCSDSTGIGITITDFQVGSKTDAYYEVIPFEYLFTSHSTPQVVVDSNGLRANCPAFNCDYAVVSADIPAATDATLSTNTLSVTIPSTYAQADLEVFFGNIWCTVSGYASDILTADCTGAEQGAFKPKVHINGLGFADNSGLSPITVSATFSSVSTLGSSSTAVNANGGTQVTISGTGFPNSRKAAIARPLTVTVGDANCELGPVSSTQIVCTVGKQSTTPSGGATATLTLSLNGVDKTSTALTFISSTPTLSTVDKTHLNPVIPATITITGSNLDSSKVATFVRLRHTVSQVVTDCEVLTTSTTSISCLYSGAKVGAYKLYATTSNGNTNELDITIKVEVTSISPTSGSQAGGTTITISGGDFSNENDQTLVSIGTDSTNVLCDVVSSSTNEVTCVTRAAKNGMTGAQDVVVLTRIQEQSTCNGACSFTYDEALTPIVSTITAGPYQPGQSVTVTGTDLGDTSTTVTIGGQSSTVSSNDGSSLVFVVPNDIAAGVSYRIVISVSGKGYAKFTNDDDSKRSVSLVLSSTTPSAGPTTGALVTVTGKGFSSSTGVFTGTTPCVIRSLTATTITCVATRTGSITVSDSNYLNVPCTPTACSITISSATAAPTITTAALASGTVTFTGTNYATPGQVRLVSSINPSVVYTVPLSVASATSASADVSSVPGGVYNLELNSNSRLSAVRSFTNDFTLNTIGSVTSSVGGGLKLTINGAGFSANAAENKVTVCGLECDQTSSSSSAIECLTPAFVNSVTRVSYPSLTPAKTLTEGVWTADNLASLQSINDGLQTTFYTTASSACQLTYNIGDGLLADITEIRYFPRVNSVAKTFSGIIVEGSIDNSAWTPIFTLDANTHDGFNYWNPATKGTVVYQYIRFRTGASTAKCAFAEIAFFGYLQSANSGNPSSGVSCGVSVVVNGNLKSQSSVVTYDSSITGQITSLSKDYGTAAGGDSLVITGTNFPTDVSPLVWIDEVVCAVTGQTATTVTCTTGPAPAIDYRRSSLDSSLTLRFPGKGDAVNNQIRFLYVDLWSQSTTWGGASPPREGDSVYIPRGQNVLVDVSTPILNAVIVEGALIFKDTPLTFDAHYVMIRAGRFQIGTWEKPIQSKITVTMHGNKLSRSLPHYGNKVIALREGILDIHGKRLTKTWSRLSSTAAKDATTITVNEVVDWNVGDTIVITSTDHDHFQSEERVIKTITPASSSTTITFDDPLDHLHYAGVQTFGSKTVEMRAEVGCITRNVKIQGDETSEANMYGVHIMTFSPGDDTSVSRISYTEVTQAGQAFNLGRYPIHFHLIGNVHQSYVIGNAVHHTYNRAVTIHGVHYLRIQKNVAYWVMGHTIFIEDGIETHNLIEDNLVINTRSSEALLNTDQTPACFWITNPNNIWRRNVCAGSERYGFWFDLRAHPEGPSATNSICPTGEPLGEFVDNEAHSVGRYGLRIFHEHIPRTYPCNPEGDYTLADPFVVNPPIQSDFKNFKGWKNHRDTIIGERLGAVKFTNVISADNIRSGIEISDGNYAPPGTLLVDGAVIVGQSANAGDPNAYNFNGGSRGLITPKVDFFYAKNVWFYNFPENTTAIETCSHCEHGAATDSGGRTSFLSDLHFDNVVQKVRFNVPFREILQDEDGSLTGIEGGSVTFSYPHLLYPGCTEDQDVFNGVVCDATVKLRRVLLYKPSNPLLLMDLRVLRVDSDSDIAAAPLESYSTVKYRKKKNPMDHWVFVGQAGKAYKVHWANGIDFDVITIEKGATFKIDDPAITLIHNHSDFRETFDSILTKSSGSVVNVTNITTLWTPATVNSRNFGDWHHDVANKRLYTVLDGHFNGTLFQRAFKCRVNCPVPVTNVEKDTVVRKWSNPASWTATGAGTGGKVPTAGEDVVIPPSWRMTLDVSTASLGYLDLQGDLIFDTTASSEIVLTATKIWVQGQLIIGASATERFTQQAKIVLTGNREAPSLILAGYLDASNKVIGVTGNLTIYGKDVPLVASKLAASVKGKTTNKITVTDTITGKWNVGDELLVVASNADYQQSEIRTITAITGSEITLNETLQFDHFGGSASDVTTTSVGTLDMRTEVLYMTRNVRISGTGDDNWGGRVYVTQIYDPTLGDYVRGTALIDGAEFVNCGQPNTTFAGLAFDQMDAEKLESFVTNSVFRQSPGWHVQIMKSEHVTFSRNVLWYSFKYSVFLDGTLKDIKFTYNYVIGNRFRGLDLLSGSVDFTSNLRGDTARITESDFSKNVFADCEWHCLTTRGDDCSTKTTGPWIWKDNVVHSGVEGFLVFRSTSTCQAVSHLTAYKLQTSGLTSFFLTKKIIAHNLIVSDAHFGFALNAAAEDKTEVYLSDSYFSATSLPAAAYAGHLGECSGNFAIMNPSTFAGGKSIPPSPSQLPWRKVKGNAVFDARFFADGLTFANFDDSVITGCKNNYIITSNDIAPDGEAVALISNSVLTNVDPNRVFHFFPPSPGSIGIDNCGGWMCTGYNNVLIKDTDGSLTKGFYSGTATPSVAFPNLQKVAESNPDCTFVDNRNAEGYVCKTNKWSYLTFQSLDGDAETRIISPINITREDGWRNDLNQMQDHGWDGFYTSLKRLARFKSVLQSDNAYTILYRGTLPNVIRFHLQGATASDYAILKQRYTKPNIVRVTLDDGTIKTPVIPRDDNPITAASNCGDYAWIPADQTIVFKITGSDSCILRTEVTNGVQLSVRYDIDIDEFFNLDGPTKFIDRVAAVLGLDLTRIRVVSVRRGSVIVETHIDIDHQEEPSNPTNTNIINNQINDIITKIGAAVGTGNLAILNAKILDYSAKASVRSFNVEEPVSNDNGASATVIAVAVIISLCAITLGGFLVYKKHMRTKVLKSMAKIRPVNTNLKYDVQNQDASNYTDSKTVIQEIITSPERIRLPDQENGSANSLRPSINDVSDAEKIFITPNPSSHIQDH